MATALEIPATIERDSALSKLKHRLKRGWWTNDVEPVSQRLA